MYQVYQIKNGDTIDSIAKMLGIDSKVISEINGLSINESIIPGNFIVIPATRSLLFDVYRVKKGDSLYEIARTFGTDMNDLLLLNGLNKADYIYPDQDIIIPKPGVSLYLTKEGDTISIVAYNLKSNPETILKQNANIYLLPNQLILHKKEKNQ